MNNGQKNIENAFYSDGYKLGLKVVDSGNYQKVLFESISEMYGSIDTLIATLSEYAHSQNQKIDCKKECEWCCHQPVFAFGYEMKFLNDFVHRNFNDDVKRRIKNRAEIKNQKLSMLSEANLLNAKSPCPLLENGVCIAYQARPMACRIYLSTNVKTCLDFFHHPEEKDNYPALLSLTLRCGQKMNEGFKATLKINEIKTEEFRIEEKLFAF